MTDIRKFMNLVELGPNDPARPVDRDTTGRLLHPDVSYGVSATKVVATLKSYKSQTYTKLAQKIEQITALEEQCSILKEEVKQEGREQIADLFSADDATRTRMIETVSFIMQITKDPVAASTVKYAKVIEELANQLTPELLTVMTALVEKYTTVQSPKAPALTYSMKPKTESLDLSEGMWDNIKALLSKFKNTVLSWGAKYDQKLAALKAQVSIEESTGSPGYKSEHNFFKTEFSKETQPVAEADGDFNPTPMAFQAGATVYSGSRRGKIVRTVQNKPESTIIELENGERLVVASNTLKTEKPGRMSRAFSKLVGESEVEEATLAQMRSGMMRDRSSIDSAKNARSGQESITIGGKEYNAIGNVKSTQLKVGDTFLNTYNAHNQGADAYEMLGFSTTHNDVVEFTSLKELAASVGGARNMQELNDKTNVHMIVRDLEDGSQGGYLYLAQGRWVRGSGAERVTFSRIEPVEVVSESPYDRVGKDFQVAAPVTTVPDNWDTTPEVEMVSTWETPKGAKVHVWKTSTGIGKVINGKGKTVTLSGIPDVSNPRVADIEKALKTVYGCKRVNVELALTDSANTPVNGESQGLTEYDSPVDAYPLAQTLSDSELVSYMQQWKLSSKQVDSDTDSGREFLEFGDELQAECESRGLAC